VQWEASDSPVNSAASTGLQPHIVCHPTYAAALLSTAAEADAVNESDTFSSYTVVEPINDDTPLFDLNNLLGILKRMGGCEGAGGYLAQKPMCHPAAA